MSTSSPSGPRVVRRQRTKGWRKPKGAINAGRPSIFANPFPVIPGVRDAVQATRMFKAWLDGRYSRTRAALEGRRLILLMNLHLLTGRPVMCWCGDWEPGQPEIPCHCVVLVKRANGLP